VSYSADEGHLELELAQQYRNFGQLQQRTSVAEVCRILRRDGSSPDTVFASITPPASWCWTTPKETKPGRHLHLFQAFSALQHHPALASRLSIADGNKPEEQAGDPDVSFL
jgi:hypothetical protein